MTTVGAWRDVLGFRNANVADIEGFWVGEFILHTSVSNMPESYHGGRSVLHGTIRKSIACPTSFMVPTSILT